jgi:Kef-type K+ transport system membrane component KefB
MVGHQIGTTRPGPTMGWPEHNAARSARISELSLSRELTRRRFLSAAVATTLLAATFVLVMVFVVKPWVERLVQASKDRAPDHQHVAATVVGLLLCALATEAIGIHALFGAFLFGVVIPHESQLAATIVASFDKLVRVLFLPAFFALTGMRTDIGLVTGWDGWLTVVLIIIVATAGKFGGTFVAAYYGGLSLRSSAALGVLVNTRGLMQLIVLTIGLDLGLLSPTLFTMMVLMAIVSTMGAAPILRRLLRFETVPMPR